MGQTRNWSARRTTTDVCTPGATTARYWRGSRRSVRTSGARAAGRFHEWWVALRRSSRGALCMGRGGEARAYASDALPATCSSGAVASSLHAGRPRSQRLHCERRVRARAKEAHYSQRLPLLVAHPPSIRILWAGCDRYRWACTPSASCGSKGRWLAGWRRCARRWWAARQRRARWWRVVDRLP